MKDDTKLSVEEREAIRRYGDLLDLPHHVSKKHRQMTMLERAAQFSPFAALTGYGDAIKETARLTDEREELDDDAKEILNWELIALAQEEDRHPTAEFTWFVPDLRKEGGSYVTRTGQIKRFNNYTGELLLVDGTVIPIAEIRSVVRENGRK